MYNMIKFFEKINMFICMKAKLIYWKLKYGKRLEIGKKIRFRSDFKINITKDGYLKIGDNNFFNNYCSINCHEKIIIGNDNIFGENVKIYDHNHIFNNKKINIKTSFNTNPIFIGSNNWFGSNVIILNKSNIGNYNVIAANTCINDKISNENLIRIADKIKKEKINYK